MDRIRRIRIPVSTHIGACANVNRKGREINRRWRPAGVGDRKFQEGRKKPCNPPWPTGRPLRFGVRWLKLAETILALVAAAKSIRSAVAQSPDPLERPETQTDGSIQDTIDRIKVISRYGLNACIVENRFP